MLSSSMSFSMSPQKYPNTNPEQRKKLSDKLSLESRRNKLKKSRNLNLNDLPYDLLIRILDSLPYRDLLQLMLICKRMCAAVISYRHEPNCITRMIIDNQNIGQIIYDIQNYF